MGSVHRADVVTSARLRNLTGRHDITEVVAYDAEFPGDDQQHWVDLVSGPGERISHNLESEDHAELNLLIEQVAEDFGETVKFWLDLEPTVTLKVKITNIYEDGEEVVNFETVSVPADENEFDGTDYDSWEDCWLWPLTGSGREDGDAGYFVEVVETTDPEFAGREWEWC